MRVEGVAKLCMACRAELSEGDKPGRAEEE